MKNMKKIISLLIVFVMFLLPITKVNAVEETIKLGNAPMTPSYVGDFAFHIKQMTNGEYLYCTNYHATTAKNVNAKLVGKMDKGITYILKNGYPTKTLTGDNTKDYYITQVAVWWYLDDTTGSNNLTSSFKSKTGATINSIRSLVVGAKAAKDTETSIDISKADTKMSLNGDYYETKEILPDTSNLSKYSVEVTGIEGAEVVTASGVVQNTFNVNEPFKVRVKASSLTDLTNTIKIFVKGTGTEYQAYEYDPIESGSAKMQNVARLVKTDKNVNSVNTATIKSYKVSIAKIDAETRKYISGAVISIKDANGKEVRRFTTDENLYIITDLPNGTYSVNEEIAPKGYIKNDKSTTFTLDDEHQSYQIEIENYKEVIVPDTATSFETILYIILGVTILGLGFVFIKRHA